MAEISVVIPTYKEEHFLPDTLNNIEQQTLFRNIEVVVADYDPNNDGKTKSIVIDRPNVRYVPVMREGIAFARHVGIRASAGYYIVNFDADSKFNSPSAVEQLVSPIEGNQCASTFCDNVYDPNLISSKSIDNLLNEIAQLAHQFLPAANASGMTMPRHIYESVGGFDDVMQHEDTMLSVKLNSRYGRFGRQYVSTAKVITSPRRVLGAKKDNSLGIFGITYGSNTSYDYSDAYR